MQKKEPIIIDPDADNRYIIFRVGGELFGIPLLDVREVVEPQPIKYIPNTNPFFLGVCNLRGQIVGVIDLRIRFGLTVASEERPVLMVFEYSKGAIAVMIDKIESVSTLPESDIEQNQSLFNSNSASFFPKKYINGIGKFGTSLVTILELRSMLSEDRLEAEPVNHSQDGYRQEQGA